MIVDDSCNIGYQDPKHNRQYSHPQQFPQQNIVYIQQDPQIYSQMNPQYYPQQQQQFYPYQQQLYVQQQGPLIVSNQSQAMVYPQQIFQQPMHISQNYNTNGEFRINSRYPVIIICPYCNKQTQTVVRSKVGLGAILLGFFLCIIFPPCFFITFFVEECHELTHKCGNCGHVIYKKCC